MISKKAAVSLTMNEIFPFAYWTRVYTCELPTCHIIFRRPELADRVPGMGKGTPNIVVEKSLHAHKKNIRGRANFDFEKERGDKGS